MEKHAKYNDEHLIVNEDGKSCDLDEYLKPFKDGDLSVFKFWDVYFIYPENGKTVDEIKKFVDFVIDLSEYAIVYIYTVSDWVLTYLNIYVYVGEMTTSERDAVNEKFGIDKYIRFKDIYADWLNYDENQNKFIFEPIPSFGSPPKFEFVYESQANELSKLLIGLETVYEDYRRE
jgi:hypothetical protein